MEEAANTILDVTLLFSGRYTGLVRNKLCSISYFVYFGFSLYCLFLRMVLPTLVWAGTCPHISNFYHKHNMDKSTGYTDVYEIKSYVSMFMR